MITLNEQTVTGVLRQHLSENMNNRLTRHSIVGLVALIVDDLKKSNEADSSKSVTEDES